MTTGHGTAARKKRRLKPCPFCAGRARLLHDQANPPQFYVFCTSCYVTTAPVASAALACRDWNRRVAEKGATC